MCGPGKSSAPTRHGHQQGWEFGARESTLRKPVGTIEGEDPRSVTPELQAETARLDSAPAEAELID